MAYQVLDDLHVHPMGRRRTDAGCLAGGQDIEAKGHVEVIDVLQKIIDQRFAGGDVPAVHLPVEAVTHIQAPGLFKQGLGIVQLADTQAAIGERHIETLASLGNLPEGCA